MTTNPPERPLQRLVRRFKKRLECAQSQVRWHVEAGNESSERMWRERVSCWKIAISECERIESPND